MLSPSDLSNLATELRTVANRMDEDAEAMAGASDRAHETIDGLGEHWGGPLSDRVLAEAAGYMTQSVRIDGLMGWIAGATRSLAGDADRIAGQLSVLISDRDNPPATLPDGEVARHESNLNRQIQDQEEAWEKACSGFDAKVAYPADALSQIARYELVLLESPRDPDLVAAIVDQFGGPEGIAQLGEILIEEGDAEGFQFLADMVGSWMKDMSPEEIADLFFKIWEESDGYGMLPWTLLLASDTLPAEVLPLLLQLQQTGPSHLDDEYWEMLEALLGSDSRHEWETAMWERVIEQHPEALDLILEKIEANQMYPLSPSPIAMAVANYLTDHPDMLDLWVNRSESGRALEMQRLIDFIGEGAGEDSLQTLVDTYAAEMMTGMSDPEDPRWGDWAARMGELQARVDDAGHSASMNGGNIAYFLINRGVGNLPGGEAVQTGMDTVKTVVGSYQSDTTYADLTTEGQQDFDNYVLAMSAVVSSDPELAAELGPMLEGEDSAEAIMDFQDGGGDLHRRVQRLQRQIEASFHDAQQQ